MVTTSKKSFLYCYHFVNILLSFLIWRSRVLGLSFDLQRISQNVFIFIMQYRYCWISMSKFWCLVSDGLAHLVFSSVKREKPQIGPTKFTTRSHVVSFSFHSIVSYHTLSIMPLPPPHSVIGSSKKLLGVMTIKPTEIVRFCWRSVIRDETAELHHISAFVLTASYVTGTLCVLPEMAST